MKILNPDALALGSAQASASSWCSRKMFTAPSSSLHFELSALSHHSRNCLWTFPCLAFPLIQSTIVLLSLLISTWIPWPFPGASRTIGSNSLCFMHAPSALVLPPSRSLPSQDQYQRLHNPPSRRSSRPSLVISSPTTISHDVFFLFSTQSSPAFILGLNVKCSIFDYYLLTHHSFHAPGTPYTPIQNGAEVPSQRRFSRNRCDHSAKTPIPFLSVLTVTCISFPESRIPQRTAYPNSSLCPLVIFSFVCARPPQRLGCGSMSKYISSSHDVVHHPHQLVCVVSECPVVVRPHNAEAVFVIPLSSKHNTPSLDKFASRPHRGQRTLFGVPLRIETHFCANATTDTDSSSQSSGSQIMGNIEETASLGRVESSGQGRCYSRSTSQKNTSALRDLNGLMPRETFGPGRTSADIHRSSPVCGKQRQIRPWLGSSFF